MIEPHNQVALRHAVLKRRGAYAVLAIKTSREEFGLSLSEGRHQFAKSPDWAADQAAAKALHQAIVDILHTGTPTE